MSHRLLLGDWLERLRAEPPESVNCCVTSPPYWGLRDYGCEGQLGLEKTPEEYVAKVVAGFREVRRVLRKDGTLWLNLGDSYATGGGAVGRCPGGGDQGERFLRQGHINTQPNRMPLPGLKAKDLVGIPWMVAFALRADGWYLRQDIIWSKPNPMPESVRDRCTKSHEYVFLLSKSEKYYCEMAAIAEPVALSSIVRLAQPGLAEQSGSPVPGKTNGNMKAASSMYGGPNSGFRKKHCPHNSQPNDKPTEGIYESEPKRNRRSVWEVSTTPYPEAHFATYPEELITPMILAGCPEGGTVLDPFAGSGTTLAVAERLGRNSLGFELNHEYIKLAEKRIAAVTPGFRFEEAAS